jgi:parvulin-like peptidyl-prolyl isomerase
MKSKLKIFEVVLAAVVCASATRAENNPAAKSSSSLDELFPDPVAVRGTGFEIKRSRFDEEMIHAKADLVSRGEEITSTRLPALERQVLDQLILDQILLSKATPEQKSKAKTEGDKKFEDIRKAEANDETFARKLRTVGLTMEKFHSRLIDDAVVQPMLRDKINVTDAQIKKYYDDHATQTEAPETARVGYILWTSFDQDTRHPLTDEEKKTKKKRADEALKRARAGEDFSKLIKEYSEDVSVKQNNGEIKFGRNSPGIPPEFEAAAFSLKTNQVSDVIATMYGYCIIKLLETIPPHKIPLSEVSKRIEDILVSQEAGRMLPRYYADLKRETHVEIQDADLKALEDLNIPVQEISADKTAGGTDAPAQSPPK